MFERLAIASRVVLLGIGEKSLDVCENFIDYYDLRYKLSV